MSRGWLSAFRRCLDIGLLKVSAREQRGGRDAYQLAAWQGDAVLALEMRSMINNQFGNTMQLSDMSRLTQRCVSNRTLAQFCEHLSLEHMPSECRWENPLGYSKNATAAKERVAKT